MALLLARVEPIISDDPGLFTFDIVGPYCIAGGVCAGHRHPLAMSSHHHWQRDLLPFPVGPSVDAALKGTSIA